MRFSKQWLTAAALLVGSYFLVLHRLDARAIHSWDEALFAARAFYLGFEGEYFANWKDIDFCEVDHPNTKPPLVTAIQALSFKLIGYSRLALRLPIALFGLMTSMLLWYLANKLKIPWAGVLAFLALLTSWGYNQHHILRTGDHDAAVAFWLFASLISFLGFQFSSKRSNTYLLLFFTLTACAVLTKSVMGFILLPAISVYALLFIPFKKTLYNRWFYLGALLLTTSVLAFYGIMEYRHSGFLQTVWQEEIGGRYVLSENRYTEPWYFYINYFVREGVPFYWVAAVVGIVFGITSRDERIRASSRLLTISLGFLLIVLSTTDTKLIWYAAPTYPIIAFFTGLGLWNATVKWLVPLGIRIGINARIMFLPGILLMAWPAFQIIERNATENTTYAYERYELHLERLRTEHPEIKRLSVHANNEWYPSFVFLGNKFEKIYGIQLDFINGDDPISSGDLLFGVYHPRMATLALEPMMAFGPTQDVKLWKVVRGDAP